MLLHDLCTVSRMCLVELFPSIGRAIEVVAFGTKSVAGAHSDVEVYLPVVQEEVLMEGI